MKKMDDDTMKKKDQVGLDDAFKREVKKSDPELYKTVVAKITGTKRKYRAYKCSHCKIISDVPMSHEGADEDDVKWEALDCYSTGKIKKR